MSELISGGAPDPSGHGEGQTYLGETTVNTDQNGKRTTYSNACFARIAKATNVSPGECPK